MIGMILVGLQIGCLLRLVVFTCAKVVVNEYLADSLHYAVLSPVPSWVIALIRDWLLVARLLKLVLYKCMLSLSVNSFAIICSWEVLEHVGFKERIVKISPPHYRLFFVSRLMLKRRRSQFLSLIVVATLKHCLSLMFCFAIYILISLYQISHLTCFLRTLRRHRQQTVQELQPLAVHLRILACLDI